jgi:thiol-disulfide isomerase/thioredoxin
MSSHWILGLLAAGVLGLAAGCGAVDVSVDPEAAPIEERDEASPFTATALDGGGEIALDDFRGTPVFLNFWASWCGPCKEEMPDLQAFKERTPGVQVIGLAVNDDPSDSRSFAQEVGVDFPLAIDRNGSIAGKYSATGLPVTVIIDAEGKIASTWFGLISAQQLDEFAEQLT